MSASTSSLRIAVVGHTNAGKTSLLRTLLQQRDFGAVEQTPSTTRDVLEQGVWLEQQQVMSFYDTPGLESGEELYALLENYRQQYRHDGPAQVEQFLQSTEAQGYFNQEAKVLRQLLQSDAAFYVIDSREPVLQKFQDELHILSRCGKPLLPVLNFTASPHSRQQEWQQALAKVNLHAVVVFDTVSPPEGGEQQLFTSLATVLPSAQQPLQKLLAQRQQQRQQRYEQSLHAIAQLLIDVSKLQLRIPASVDESTLNQHVSELRHRIRTREQQTVQELLTRFAFLAGDAELAAIDIEQGEWREDLFADATLKAWGKDAGFGVGAGAAAGAGIDLLVGGMSLGAATALGAAAGGLYQSWRYFGDKIKQKMTGERVLQIDSVTLVTLVGRQLLLLQQLSKRGHAATEALRIDAQAIQQQRLSRSEAKELEQLLAPLRERLPDINESKLATELVQWLGGLSRT